MYGKPYRKPHMRGRKPRENHWQDDTAHHVVNHAARVHSAYRWTNGLSEGACPCNQHEFLVLLFAWHHNINSVRSDGVRTGGLRAESSIEFPR